jgi:hypothetical protein
MQLPTNSKFALALALAVAPLASHAQQQPAPQSLTLKASPDEIEVLTFYQGEFDRPTFSLWGQRLPCGIDLDKWAQTRCGGNRRWIFKPVTDGISGNRCGYQGFALVCFNPAPVPSGR